MVNFGGHDTAEQALAEIRDRLVTAHQPLALYLFGSRATGTARPDSDFDILMVTALDPDHAQAGWAYAPLVGRGIACDVLPVSAADFLEERNDPTSLCFDIERRGRRIYERSAAD